MKVRVANEIYDETSVVLANGDVRPAHHCSSINAAKRLMRPAAYPKRAFRSWKAAEADGGVGRLVGLQTPSVASGVAEGAI